MSRREGGLFLEKRGLNFYCVAILGGIVMGRRFGGRNLTHGECPGGKGQ